MQNYKNFLLFILGFVVGALIWGVSTIFLAKTPTVQILEKKDFDFFNINLSKLFYERSKKSIEPKPIVAEKLDIKLKAIYNRGNFGFIVIEDKKKNYFVDLNGEYKGYKLIKIYPNSAIFRKNGKDYKIEIEDIKMDELYKKSENKEFEEENIKIPKKVFLEYKNDFSKIKRNIGIMKVKKGYKITYVRKNSIFEKIGLKKGDILLEVNGRVLKNDADAWDLYKNADKFNNYEIVILRNNQEKVLNYEVD